MRKIILSALLAVILAACTNEAYDSGDTPLSYLSAEWVDVTTNSAGLVAQATTDAGQRLILSPPYRAEWIGQTPDTTCRALLYHGQVSGGVTDAKAIQPVLMADVATRNPNTTYPQDPIVKARAWRSANKKYLNMVLTLKVGRQQDAPAQQRVGVLCDSVTTLADGTRCCWLTIVHDQNGVPAYYSQEACVSVLASRLSGAQVVRLRLRTYDGEKVLEIN